MSKITKIIMTAASVAALSFAINSPVFAMDTKPFTVEFAANSEGHDIKMNINQTGNVTISNVGSKIIFTAPENGFPTQPVGIELIVDGAKVCQYKFLCTPSYMKDGHLMQNCKMQQQNYGAKATEIVLGTIDYGVRAGCVVNIAISTGNKGSLACTGTFIKK
jgi:hypothetical protein